MPFDTARLIGGGGVSGALFALVKADGTHAHRHAAALCDRAAPMHDVTDAVHIACILHGRQPGVIDHACAHTHVPVAAAWLAEAADAFATERQYLAAIVSAAGPLPSTPGQAESESAVTAQRHALDMLAQSDRVGCAFGAAAALALDWAMTREIFDGAADRLGLADVALALPAPHETAFVVDSFGDRPAVERALLFGAQQFLAQQRGLWDLLEARSSARLHA